MPLEINCEDFALTDAIKAHVSNLAEKIQEDHSENLSLLFFLSRNGRKNYRVGIETRFLGNQIYTHADDTDIYLASTQAKRTFRKKLIELAQKKKTVDRHKKVESGLSETKTSP